MGQGTFEMVVLEMLFSVFVLVMYVGIMVVFLLLAPLPSGER